MKNVLVLTTSLGLGGITSFLIPLVNELSKKYNVTLAYTTDECNKLVMISDDVKKVPYSMPGKKSVAMYMIKRGWGHHILKIKMRNHADVSPMDSIQRVTYASAIITKLPLQLEEEYDVAISTAEFYCNSLVALKIAAKKKIGWIHPDYKALHTDVAFDKNTLDKLDFIVTVSESTRKSLIGVLPEYEKKAKYLPNLLDVEEIEKKSKEYPVEYLKYKDKKIITTVCRIDNSSKRLDRVISIAKAMIARGEKFHWFIVGNGPDFEMMRKGIQNEGLSDTITMTGMRENPYPYIRYADLFVLTSQYEGRPVVVDEAIALGCPVIVTEYASAREQVKENNGCIMPNDDDAVIDAFLNSLNWSKITEMKKCKIKCVESTGYDLFWREMKKMFGETE